MKYNIENLAVNHPTTGTLIDTATSVDVCVEILATGARGYYELHNSSGSLIMPYGRHNEPVDLTGWTGNFSDLEAQILTRIGATVTT